MGSVELMDNAVNPPRGAAEHAGYQAAAYFLELSPDWAIRRISSNSGSLFGRDAASLVGVPLGTVVATQPLHDLRNLCARASANTGIARAFGVRLSDTHGPVDIAFQWHDGRVLFEAVPSPAHFGVAFGSVGGLIASLDGASGPALGDGAARRMRALSGHDRVTLLVDGERWTSGRFASHAEAAEIPASCPTIVADCEAATVAILPDSQALAALMCAPDEASLEILRRAGTRSLLRIPFARGEFVCECSRPRAPSFELHAAAELFAQMFALRLELDRR